MSKKGGNNEKQEKQRKLDWIDLALKEFKDRVLQAELDRQIQAELDRQIQAELDRQIQAELDRQIDEIKGRVKYFEQTSSFKN